MKNPIPGDFEFKFADPHPSYHSMRQVDMKKNNIQPKIAHKSGSCDYLIKIPGISHRNRSLSQRNPGFLDSQMEDLISLSRFLDP